MKNEVNKAQLSIFKSENQEGNGKEIHKKNT